MLAGNEAFIPSNFESIATTTVGAGGSSAIEFTSIPSTYKHLQIRLIGRTNRSTPADMDNFSITFNSDTGNNYSDHALRGDGSSASATVDTSANHMEFYRVANTYVNADTMGAGVVDILEYANTNIYKTVRALAGVDNNGSGMVALNSGSWRSTSAVTSIKITPTVGTSFTQDTHIALYGIKG